MISSKQKRLTGILSGISVVLLIIALFLGSSCVTVGVNMYSQIDTNNLEAEQFAEEPVIITGVLTTCSFEENTVVTYEFEGETYTSEQIVYSDEYAVGSEVQVYVNPARPSDIRVPEIYNAVYSEMGKVLLIAGLIISVGCTTISVILILICRSIKKKSSKLD